MDIQKIISIILLAIATLVIAIFGIPFWVLGLGLLTMAKPRKDDKEERIKEPFTGY